jgi:hypothetical protein
MQDLVHDFKRKVSEMTQKEQVGTNKNSQFFMKKIENF